MGRGRLPASSDVAQLGAVGASQSCDHVQAWGGGGRIVSELALPCQALCWHGRPVTGSFLCQRAFPRPLLEVRQVSDLPGLGFFKKDSSPSPVSPWTSWRSWPHMTLAMDMGSDNMSAYWWMVSEEIAISPVWDWSHGCSNDWKGMLRAVSLMPFWTLMIVTWNSATGPRQDMIRWRQLEEAWRVMFEQHTSETCPLFTEYCSHILEDRGGATSLMGSGDPDRLLWNALRVEPPVREVQRVNLNRYFSTPRRAEAEVKRWHQTLMTNEFIAVEEGMLSNARVEKLVVQNDSAAEAEQRGTTNPGAVTYSDRALKASQGTARCGVCRGASNALGRSNIHMSTCLGVCGSRLLARHRIMFGLRILAGIVPQLRRKARWLVQSHQQAASLGRMAKPPPLLRHGHLLLGAGIPWHR